MVQLRPKDLPGLRAELLEFGKNTTFETLVDLRSTWGNGSPVGPAERELAGQFRDACRLEEAELFYVSPEMCELIDVAARSLPEFVLAHDDPPSRDGLAYISSTIHDIDAEGTHVVIHGFSWVTTPDRLQLSIYVDRSELPAHLRGYNDKLRDLGFPVIFPLGAWVTPIGADGLPEPISAKSTEMEGIGSVGLRALAFLKSLWLLMRQPLTVQQQEQVDRATRKRLARQGVTEPAPIRVLQLRRPPHSSTGTNGEAMQWHHQWIVRGHWRNQAFGEGRRQRRPVWISPHVKGPEGAPMLGGEKVYMVNDG